MSDFLVIGGGINGLLTARELALAGAEVTLVERARPGGEASWAGGGILSPLYPWRYPDAVTRLAHWSQLHYRELADALTAAGGTDPELLASGLLIAAVDDRTEALAWARRWGVSIEVVDAAAIAALEPALTRPLGDGLWLPGVAQVRNPRLVRAALRALDGTVRQVTQRPVSALVVADGRVRGVRCGRQRLAADRVVVCAGAWSARLLAGLGVDVAIAPVRGQMLLFPAIAQRPSRIVLHDDRYAIPRADGQLLFGSTLEQAGFDTLPTAAAHRELRARARGLIPALADHEPVAQWTGLRPGTPDGIPYIGPHPHVEGLFINAGQFRNGLVLAPGSARLLADLALGRDPIVPPEPYAIAAGRDPGTTLDPPREHVYTARPQAPM